MSDQRRTWQSIIGFSVFMGLVIFGGRLLIDTLFGDPLDLGTAAVIGAVIAAMVLAYGAAVRAGWTPPNQRT